MFNKISELTVKQDYEDRVRRTAQENFATKMMRAERNRTSILARLGNSVVHLSFHLQRRPHDSFHHGMAPKAPQPR